MPVKAKVGLLSVGLDAYWPQFPELRPELERQGEAIARQLREFGATVIYPELLDNAAGALALGRMFREAGIDLLFLHAATYALSSTILPVVRKAGLPVVVLNLAPGAAIDYRSFNRLPDRGAMTGEWLRWCQGCSVPEFANVFLRCGIPFFQVTGMLENDADVARQLQAWTRAAAVGRALEETRIGLLGHYYSGMLDIYSDVTQLCAQFGFHAEMLEVDELSERLSRVSEEEARARVKLIHELFDVRPDCPAEEVARAARTSVALDGMVREHDLGALAYYHKGVGNPANLDAIASIIVGTSLLTARGIPVAGEYEVKNCVAMKILDLLGCGGSFTEFYAMDYGDDVVLMGHDGPGHPGIAQGKVKVKPLDVFHGKVGAGLSVEMSVQTGPATLLSVVQTASAKTKLLVAEAESVPGPILEIGNSNSRYRFPIGARGFVERWNAEGPAHHCAVGSGHLADTLRKFAAITGADFVQIC